MPATYFVTNKIFRVVTNESGAPTYLGVLLHSIVFLLLARLLMQVDNL
jgi:lipopolysaccharide export LptBFGC system permease protein LptF